MIIFSSNIIFNNSSNESLVIKPPRKIMYLMICSHLLHRNFGKGLCDFYHFVVYVFLTFYIDLISVHHNRWSSFILLDFLSCFTPIFSIFLLQFPGKYISTHAMRVKHRISVKYIPAIKVTNVTETVGV